MMDWTQYEEEQKQEARRYWSRLAVVALVAAALIYGIFYVRDALADAFRSPGGEVALVRHQAKCDDADILAHILRLGGGQSPRAVQEGDAHLRRARLALVLD